MKLAELGRRPWVGLMVYGGLLISARSGLAGEGIAGVYALGKVNSPTAALVLQDPNLDGIALRFGWTTSNRLKGDLPGT